MTALSGAFNFYLDETLSALETSEDLPGIHLIRMDMFATLQEIIGDAESYGFTNWTDAAILSPTYNPETDTYVFWDPVHPTTSSHELLSEFVLAHLLEAETSLMSQSASATVTIDVGDVTTPPQASIAGPVLAVPGQPLSYTLSAVDASSADQAAPMTYTVDWNGDGTDVETFSGPASELIVEHVYTTPGTRPIQVTATDQDGDTGPAAALGVDVSIVALIDRDLYVGGTMRADTVSVATVRLGKVDVQLNDDDLGRYALDSEARVVVFGQKGNDWIDASRLARSAILYGGRGHDVLFGGSDADELHGGGGNDLLFGGLSNDLLFGDAGNDWLFGGPGDDELDGGDGFDWLFGGLGVDLLTNGERNFE
jgi:Ca2+-binding RTX toxin-like protein